MTSPDICARPAGLHDSDSSFLLPNVAASLLTGEALSKLAAFSIVASTVQTGSVRRGAYALESNGNVRPPG